MAYLHNSTPFHIFLRAENEQQAISQALEYLQSELNTTNIEIIGAYQYNTKASEVTLPEKLPLETFLKVIQSAAGGCSNPEVRFYAEGGGIGACAAGAYITVYCNGKEIVTFTTPTEVLFM